MTIARKLWLPWIEEERKIAEENGLKFTPDEFLDAKRFEALKKGLDRQTRGGRTKTPPEVEGDLHAAAASVTAG